jgi:hypothetical protein
MIFANLQEENVRDMAFILSDLTFVTINGIIPKIHIAKAMMETSMLLAGSQRTRVGVSRAISTGRKSFLSVN